LAVILHSNLAVIAVVFCENGSVAPGYFQDGAAYLGEADGAAGRFGTPGRGVQVALPSQNQRFKTNVLPAFYDHWSTLHQIS
jgi:hypothetical protein